MSTIVKKHKLSIPHTKSQGSNLSSSSGKLLLWASFSLHVQMEWMDGWMDDDDDGDSHFLELLEV